FQAEPGAKGRKGSGERMSGLGDRDRGPEQLSQPVTPVGTTFNREVYQKSEMLAGAEPDRLAGGGEQRRLTQATEVPLRLHEGLRLDGVSRLCRPDNQSSTS